MSRPTKPPDRHQPATSATPGRRFPTPVALTLAAALVVTALIWWNRQPPDRATDRATAAATPAAPGPSTNPPASASTATTTTATPHPAFAKLIGKWLRPDGDYVIEIRNVEPGGRMDAGYFNPRPIRVARAEASPEGATAKVFIELRDVNYPGSTYTLIYDPATDHLAGIYFQATAQENFDVYFERMKP